MKMFDVELAMDAGVCSFAGRQKGKTNLFKGFVEELIRNDVIVTVFDPSQAWLRDSPIEYKVTVYNLQRPIENPDLSVIYDISRLSRLEMRIVVNAVVAYDFDKQANTYEWLRQPRFYVFEEAQLFATSQSVKWLEEIYKLITIGANYKMSYGLISQRPASVDTEAISRCSQIYIGNMWESNDLRKVRNYLNYPRKETYEVVTNLPLGTFIYIKDGKKRIFTAKRYIGLMPLEIKKPSLTQRIANLLNL